MPKRVSRYTKKQEQYQSYLKSAAWKRRRLQVLERDKNRCTKCGSGIDLQVHHLTYVRVFMEYLEDLTTLCKMCHQHTHKVKPKVRQPRPKRKKGKKGQAFYGRQLNYMEFRVKKDIEGSKARTLREENRLLHERQVRARENRERRASSVVGV